MKTMPDLWISLHFYIPLWPRRHRRKRKIIEFKVNRQSNQYIEQWMRCNCPSHTPNVVRGNLYCRASPVAAAAPIELWLLRSVLSMPQCCREHVFSSKIGQSQCIPNWYAFRIICRIILHLYAICRPPPSIRNFCTEPHKIDRHFRVNIWIYIRSITKNGHWNQRKEAKIRNGWPLQYEAAAAGSDNVAGGCGGVLHSHDGHLHSNRCVVEWTNNGHCDSHSKLRCSNAPPWMHCNHSSRRSPICICIKRCAQCASVCALRVETSAHWNRSPTKGQLQVFIAHAAHQVLAH